MPIILDTDRKTWSTRIVVFFIYLVLIAGGATMAYPFMITVSSALTTRYDYPRFSPVPRAVFSRNDRFMRGMTDFQADRMDLLRFKYVPAYWSSWNDIVRDESGVDKFVRAYVDVQKDSKRLAQWRVMSADYADFNLDYDIHDTFCYPDNRDLAGYLYDVYSKRYLSEHPQDKGKLSGGQLRQRALDLLSKEWGIPYQSFYDAEYSSTESTFPMHQRTWDYPENGKIAAFLKYKDAYRRMVFRPGAEGGWRDFVRQKGKDAAKAPWPVEHEDADWWVPFKEYVGQSCPISPTRPFGLKEAWWQFFSRDLTKVDLAAYFKDHRQEMLAYYRQNEAQLFRRWPSAVRLSTMDGGPQALDFVAGIIAKPFDYKAEQTFEIVHFNVLFEMECPDWNAIPFPVPPSANARLVEVWERFRKSLPAGTRIPEPNAKATAVDPLKKQWVAFFELPQTRQVLAEYVAADLPKLAGYYAEHVSTLRRQWSEAVRFKQQARADVAALADGLLGQTFDFVNNTKFEIVHYNVFFRADYSYWQDIPFPVPDGQDIYPKLGELWNTYVWKHYPRRLMELKVTPELQKKYQAFIEKNYRTIDLYNRTTHSSCASFTDIRLPARDGDETWRNFIDAERVAKDDFVLHSSEDYWQKYLLAKYGDVKKVNDAYGWKLNRIEEAEIPFAEAYTVTFINHDYSYFADSVWKNFSVVFEFLFQRGRAFANTILFCGLTILGTLTVNPLAAYALSRFRLRATEQILLFLLVTMAFPTAVRAIPGFLLMRDLGLLNTFAALVLPGLANGLSIFILKGFFDGLPRELYEAATIDGASEVQMFYLVTFPLTTPILAVNALNAFLGSYKSWDWALIVCQDKDYWTLSVWLYQMYSTWAPWPYLVMAAFVVASIPTVIVFLSCQKVILRGIVLPAMK